MPNMEPWCRRRVVTVHHSPVEVLRDRVGSEPTSEAQGRSSIREQAPTDAEPESLAGHTRSQRWPPPRLDASSASWLKESGWDWTRDDRAPSGSSCGRSGASVASRAVGRSGGRVQKELKRTAGSAVETMQMCLPGGS
jgi:hypothetical protein